MMPSFLNSDAPEASPPGGAERRRHPRISTPYPAKVLGLAHGGVLAEIDTEVENISAGGLYLKLGCEVAPGESLSFVVRFITRRGVLHGEGEGAPGLAVSGTVLRANPQPDGSCGVAVRFTHYRFL